MGVMVGGKLNWDKDDLNDVRKCGCCLRPMRHADAKPELFPGTVAHRAAGNCKTCSRANPRYMKNRTKEMEERNLAAALKVQEAIRARRQRLGITPDGRILPRRVTVG